MQVNITGPSGKSVAIFLAGAALALGVAFGPRAAEHLRPKPAPPAPAPAPSPNPEWFGLRYDQARHLSLASARPTFSKAAPALMQAGPADGRPILLYRAWTDLFRDFPPYPAQQIGDCVSFGHAHANDLLQCVEWCLTRQGKKPTPADIQETDTEFLYGAARKAGGMLGPFDGCYGSAAVEAMTKTGILSRRMLGADGQYSGRRAKQWGRTGPPSGLEAKAAAFKLGDAAKVTTWDELVAAIRSGHPVTICSNQGFSLQRDDQGFCRAQGHWAHCMFIAGVRFDREGACIVQSWGPRQPAGPTALGQPSYSFWADRAVVERILGQGDSWALSKAPHFGQSAAAKGRRRLPAHWREAA